MFFHSSYLLLIPGMLLMFWAQSRVRGTYDRYSNVSSSLGMTGADVARSILNDLGFHDIAVEHIQGELTDHYDPSAKTVRLSSGVYGSDSLAAAAVAAHECGHVMQDKQGYTFMNLRASLVPAANIGSQFGPILVILGIFLNAMAGVSSLFINLGIILFAASILFHVVTLPVEFDASSRALRIVQTLGILDGEERRGAKAVLDAAAWTYVATAIYSVLQLVQLLMISRD
ncbi:MAG: zinc metallopeptidase [Coleofasciculaceae cyanobacterium RL_1_1]|nr:zinc metallopeptidase [Coleofasciculaceae cyanobacterium RL_1_1]